MESKRNTAFLIAAAGLAAFLTFAAGLAAQQVSSTQPVTKMVPDNPSEHPAPAQPIPYSHKKHLAFGLECKQCHTNPEPGKLMTFPATATCMQCHVTIAKDKPSIQKLAEYSKSKQPIPWVRVYTVLPGVAWSHRFHLEAGVKCETCHGHVRELDAMSEVTSVTTMYSCLNCHELNKAKTACDTCHKR
jgi:Cytochrome c7 and related cytochrome c/Class III cytochrome C family